MNLRILYSAFLIIFSLSVSAQSDQKLNQTDAQGRKQGHWIKKFTGESVVYDGYFKDDHPVGEFKRYFENQSIKSILTYSDDGKTAQAVIYHPNGNISARGTYIDQLKEGKWQFFSEFVKEYLISEEYYKKNLRNGISVKFYPDSSIAEKVNYIDDVKQGEWIEYYPSGTLSLKSNFRNGKVNGKFEVWYENGAIEYSGKYINDLKEGLWTIYNKDGSIKYSLEYQLGFTKNKQMEIDESRFIDSLENNKGKIADPEKTGIIKK
jgi:antitoxin component YwqK of YwqJK toxin-antitoxin module